MKRIRYIQVGWVLLLVALLLGLVATPAGASSRTARGATAINANIYIATAALQPLFQDRINQQVPGTFNSAMASIIGSLPQQDQGWARQLAGALIQPSVALTGLRPQAGGLATSLRVSLYPGDPRPIDTSMLVSFSVLNSSTIQVSTRPLNNGPALVNGPLTTFQIPIGRLNRIAATPSCGSSGLMMNLQYPLSLAQTQAGMADMQQPASLVQPAGTTVNAYVEIPATSLAALGNSIGSMPVNSNMTAQNIHVGVQGRNLLVTSDIDLAGTTFRIGVATTTLAPTAAGGNLAVHVLNTTLTVFQFFTFPYNSYNQQTEQTLNAKLNGALAGKFHVTQAGIGPTGPVPCVAGNSLLLTGTTTIG
ncbi:MAG: hypothetical protein ABI456_14200 [Ktedonobacteraceae bacterium]